MPPEKRHTAGAASTERSVSGTAVHYIETGSTDPCFNLAFEEHVLHSRREGEWLMLWQNAPSVIIGLNQNAAEEIDSAYAEAHGIAVVRRMTGGGAVYHDLGNLNYSFFSDVGNAETLSIRRFTEPVCRALAALGVRAETSGRNDILVDGRKVSGVAQRIDRERILHHGTLLFDSDMEVLARVLRADPEKYRSRSAKSVRSRVANLRAFLPEGTTLQSFRERLLRELARDGLVRETPEEEELRTIRRCAEKKYRSWDWTYGRGPDYDYRERRRFPGGSLEVRYRGHDARIRDLVFYGDFMAADDNRELAQALEGVRADRRSVGAVLDRFDLRALFGTITREELLSVIVGDA